MLTGRARIASLAAVIAAVVVGVFSAGPAAAEPIPVHGLTDDYPAAVGSIDATVIQYSDWDSQNAWRPRLHITGWAADLLHPAANGVQAWVQLTVNGSWNPFATATNEGWAVPRPDVQRVYPTTGPNQGFDITVDAPQSGRFTFCANMTSPYAWRVSAPFACATVDVPASAPTYRATLSTTSGVVGAPVSAAVTGSLGGPASLQWLTEPPTGWRPTAVPGATTDTYTPVVADIGHNLWLASTRRMSAERVIQVWSSLADVPFPIPINSTRIAGDDRFATSVAVSRQAFPDTASGAPVAYLASGTTFPDALSAGAAAAHRHGTLLLTRPESLDPRVAAELVRLHPATVVVAGGPAAVSEAVVAQVRALPFAPTVVRVAGPDRFATSRAIIADAFGTAIPSLFLATGDNYPDALTAAAAGASTGQPVLLTDGWSPGLDAATAAALSGWGTSHVTVVGGTTSVSNGIYSDMLHAGITVERAAGYDRFDTAAKLASRLGPTGRVYFATGFGFADALTAAVLAGRSPAPLLLSAGGCAPLPTMQVLLDQQPGEGIEIGGNPAESSSTSFWSLTC
ncbi:hypothetical protein A0130_12715 [Leifsonia xyli]|uniref:cell wall-binding repeat-containing protein n=1 Tax=Leifsonia xyli TaxID=1575 RepID=UPI0007CE0635|nr:hypothetical protein A0130_12715 [Leifsonia xyli]